MYNYVLPIENVFILIECYFMYFHGFLPTYSIKKYKSIITSKTEKYFIFYIQTTRQWIFYLNVRFTNENYLRGIT